MSNTLLIDITSNVVNDPSNNIRKRKAMSDETKAKIANSQTERYAKRIAASIENQAPRATIKKANFMRNYYIREDGVKMKDNLTYSRYETLVKCYLRNKHNTVSKRAQKELYEAELKKSRDTILKEHDRGIQIKSFPDQIESFSKSFQFLNNCGFNVNENEIITISNSLTKDTRPLNLLECIFKLVYIIYPDIAPRSKSRIIHKSAELIVKHYDDKKVLKNIEENL